MKNIELQKWSQYIYNFVNPQFIRFYSNSKSCFYCQADQDYDPYSLSWRRPRDIDNIILIAVISKFSDALASLALMIVTGSLTDRNWSQSVWSHWIVWSPWSFRSVQSPWSVLSLVSLVTLVILVTLVGLVTPVNMHDFAYCIIYTLHNIHFYLAHLWADFQFCSITNRFCNIFIKYIVIFSIGASWCGFAGISPLASESLLDITRIDHHFGILATVPKKPHNQLKSHHLKTSFQIIRDPSKKTLTVIF